MLFAVACVRRPDLIEFQKLRKDANEANLENAFRVADESLGLPQLLDVQGVRIGICACACASICSSSSTIISI